jgi:hypothetical protein
MITTETILRLRELANAYITMEARPESFKSNDILSLLDTLEEYRAALEDKNEFTSEVTISDDAEVRELEYVAISFIRSNYATVEGYLPMGWGKLKDCYIRGREDERAALKGNE